MRELAVLALSVAVVFGAVPLDDSAGAKGTLKPVTKSDTVAQNSGSYVAHGASITDPDHPFAFTKVGKLRRLGKLTITASIYDGSTGPDDFDTDHLTLALDGIDTGILLNGFKTGETVTQTITGVPRHAKKILAALQKDGKLAASIIDATPDDSNALGLSEQFDTTLVLTGKKKG